MHFVVCVCVIIVTILPLLYIFQAPDGEHEGKADVPLHVINNYFSVGADAQIALEFHNERGTLVTVVGLATLYQVLVTPFYRS